LLSGDSPHGFFGVKSTRAVPKKHVCAGLAYRNVAMAALFYELIKDEYYQIIGEKTVPKAAPSDDTSATLIRWQRLLHLSSAANFMVLYVNVAQEVYKDTSNTQVTRDEHNAAVIKKMWVLANGLKKEVDIAFHETIEISAKPVTGKEQSAALLGLISWAHLVETATDPETVLINGCTKPLHLKYDPCQDFFE